MKLLFVGAVVAALSVSAAPAAAAGTDVGAAGSVRAGTFAGARLRVPLGPQATGTRARLGLTLAPTLRGEGADGRVHMRFGEGVGLSLAGARAGDLSIGGRTVASFAPRDTRIDRNDATGVSDLGWVAIGAGTILVLGSVYFLLALGNASD